MLLVCKTNNYMYIHVSLNIGISLPTRKTRFSKNVHLKIMQGGFIGDNTN